MATNYPGALDSYTNPTSTDTLDSATVPHATQHTNLNDAVVAVETALGANLSKVAALAVANTFTASPQQVTVATAANVGLIVKGAASQTGDLQQWQNSAGTLLSRITSSGQLGVPNVYSVNGSGAYLTMNSTSGAVVINTNAAGNIGAIIRSVASQTANLQEWQNSTPTTMASVDVNGRGSFTNLRSTTATSIFTVTSAASIVLTVKGAASQTANLQEWQNSGATVLAKVDATGNIVAGNMAIATSSVSTIHISNGTIPSANPTGGGVLYVESGALKYRGSSGTITTLGAA